MTGLENWDLINQAYGEACSSTTLSPTAHKHTVANHHKNLSPSCFQTNFIVLVKTKARTSPYKDISVFSCTHASDRLQPSCLLPSRLPSSLHVWDMVLPDCVGMRSRRDYVCAQSLITSFRIDYYSSGLQSQWVTVEASKTLSCTAWRCHSVYMCVWVNVVKWSQACLLQSDRHFFPSLSRALFFLSYFLGGAAQYPPACLTLSSLRTRSTRRGTWTHWALWCRIQGYKDPRMTPKQDTLQTRKQCWKIIYVCCV